MCISMHAHAKAKVGYWAFSSIALLLLIPRQCLLLNWKLRLAAQLALRARDYLPLKIASPSAGIIDE